MRLYLSSDTSTILQNKYIFLDNDFLNELASKSDVFVTFVTEAKIGQLLIDPLTEFEFLRNVFRPEQIKIKQDFLSKDIFLPVDLHINNFVKIRDNALILSKIYAHKIKSRGASYVDLHLAGRLMSMYTNTLLITGNRQDFPNCIFTILDVIDIEQGDETVKPYYIMEFDRGKFQACYKELNEVP